MASTGAFEREKDAAPSAETESVTLIITDEDVGRLLSMRECIDAMRIAFEDFSKRVAVNRPRIRYLAQHPDPERRYFANVHLGAVPSLGTACVRAGSQIMRPPNAKGKRRVYENPGAFNWGIVILYSIETAEPLAFLHEFQLSGLRVGATTGLAVDRLTRKDATNLGLFGTGKQARNAFEAITTVRKIERVHIYSPNADHRSDFARTLARPGMDVIAVDNPSSVVAGADIVCCATSSMEPLFDGNLLEPGQFVVTIANTDVTNKRSEVDRRTFERASAVVVNDWESVVDNQQTELLEPLENGALRRDQVHELGDVLTGKADISQTIDDGGIVYFKNNSGLAIQFAAAGSILYRKAMEEGRCRSIPTEWFGSDLYAYYEAGFRPSP